MVGIDSCWLCVEMCVVGTWRFLNCLRAELTSTSLTARQRRHRHCAKFKVVPRTPFDWQSHFSRDMLGWPNRMSELRSRLVTWCLSRSAPASETTQGKRQAHRIRTVLHFIKVWPPDSFGSELQLSVATNRRGDFHNVPNLFARV